MYGFDRMVASRMVVPALGSALLALFASFAFWGAAFLHWEKTGFGDWQQFHHMWESGRVSLLVHGEFPFLNPHQCGGMNHWGNPQYQLLSPIWWLTGLPFGTTLGHKLFIVVHTALGLMGVALFARRELCLDRIAAAFAAAAFAFSGTFVWDGAGGHATFLSFYFIPWLLLAWRRSVNDPRYCAAVAAVLGLTMVEAATYPPPFFLLLLAFDSLALLAKGERLLRLLRTVAISGTLSLLVCACRIAPVLITLSEHPRHVATRDHMTALELVEAWTTREHDWLVAGHPYVWAEYGAFVGWLVLVLGVVGLLLSLRKRASQDLLVGFVLFSLYAMGAAGEWFPWTLTHQLPFYSSLRVPSRFLVFATFYLALGAGLAMDRLPHAVRWCWRRLPRSIWLSLPARRVSRLLVGLVFVVALLDIGVVSIPITDRWRGNPLPQVQKTKFQMTRSGHFSTEYAAYPRRSLGTPYCREEVPIAISPALWMGPAPQVRLKEADQGKVTSWRRSSQRFFASLELSMPGRAYFNQNYSPEWRSDRGTVVEDKGLLALDLPAGRHRVKLEFVPRDLPWSALVSLVGLVLALLLWFSGRWLPGRWLPGRWLPGRWLPGRWLFRRWSSARGRPVSVEAAP